MTTENTPGRDKILEAALAEFAYKGYEGARVDRIAAAAGVNKALIYYHFKNKEELYVAAVNDLFLRAAPQVIHFPPGMPIKERVLLVTRHFVSFLHGNPLFVRIMDHAVYQEKAIFERLPQQNAFFEMTVELYREGLASGEVRPVANPVDMIIALLGASYFFYSHRNAVGKFYEEANDSEQLLQIRLSTMEELVTRVFFFES